MEDRKFLTPRGLLLCGALLLLCGALALGLSLSPRGTVAILEREGQTLLTQELSLLSGTQTHTVQGAGGIQLTVELSPQGAAVVSSTCPDQTCVKTGRLTRAGESAVCLPAQVVLRLEGGGRGSDAVTG